MNGDRLKTLLLHANGVGSTIICVDTLLRGVLGYRDGDLPPWPLRRHSKAKLVFARLRDGYANLSYIADWREAFLRSPRLEVDVCNINNLVEFGQYLLKIGRYDLIVVAHSAAGDDVTVLSRVRRLLDRRRGKMVVFLGNEYDILDDKIAFIRETEAEYICTQLPMEGARYLYVECEKAKIIEMPHALNPKHYYALEHSVRETDVGFVGDIYWPFVGDRERTNLIEWFETHGASANVVCDIRKQRLPRQEWNTFLNSCKAVVGAESGTYYLNDRGRVLERARAYNLYQNQTASFEDVFERFYRDQPCEVSGKSISSRHFEPIGAKTCQLLLEGHYNGILKPNEHYIPIKKDLSDIQEAIAKFRDETFRDRITQTAYDYVMENHTYDHRVARLMEFVT